jgi:PAS domain-containing protein
MAVTRTTQDGSPGPATFFAPPERASVEHLQAMARGVVHNPVVSAVLEAAAGYVMVLDEHRQILAANEEVLDALGVREGQTLVGKRPGEAFSCVHASEGPNGCGTSRECGKCGAVLTVLAAMARGEASDGVCSLTMVRPDGVRASMELGVHATPVLLAGARVIVVTLLDLGARPQGHAP